MRRGIFFIQLCAVFRRICANAVLVTQFLLNYLHFLAEIIFPLILVDSLLCFVFDFALDLQNLTLVLHGSNHHFQTFIGIQPFQEFLLSVVGKLHPCGNDIRKRPGSFRRYHIAHQIQRGSIIRQLQIIIIFLHRNFHNCLLLLAWLFLKILRNGRNFGIIAVFHMDIQKSAAVFPLHHNMCQIAGQLQHLLHLCQNTDVI